MPSNKSVDKALANLEKDMSKKLSLNVGKHTNIDAGLYIPRADAQSPPDVFYSLASPDKTYLVIALDLDAPFVSFNKLGPILHWLQPGFKISSANAFKLESTEAFIANYIGPAPPPGAAPHRYVFFLYEQPEGLEASKFAPEGGSTFATTKRMWASLDDWEAKLGLGEVIAVNYFKSN